MNKIPLKLFKSRDKKGYRNAQGKVVIPAIYDDAHNFSEGLAKVFIENRWGFINTRGKVVIPLQFDTLLSFSDGRAGAYDGKKWGYLDARGRWAIRPAFDDAEPFSEGLASVSKDRRWGWIDLKGRWKIKPAYDETGDFNNGFAWVRKGSRQGWVNTQGQLVPGGRLWSFEFKDNAYPKDFPKRGVLPVCVGKKWGLIDTAGKFILEPRMDSITSVDAGMLLPACENGKAGYLTPDGEWALEPRFEYAGRFTSFGTAEVKLNSMYGIINKKGEWVLPCKYECVILESNGRFSRATMTRKTHIEVTDLHPNGKAMRVRKEKLLEEYIPEYSPPPAPVLSARLSGKAVALGAEERELAERLKLDVSVLEEIKRLTQGPLEALDAFEELDESDASAWSALRSENRSSKEDILPRLRKLLPSTHVAFYSKSSAEDCHEEIAVLARSNPLDIPIFMGTDQTVSGVRQTLGNWMKRHPFDILGAGEDWLEIKFHKTPQPLAPFCRELYNFCPEEIADENEYAAALKKSNRLSFWWD